MEIDVNDLILDDEPIEANIDREYYIDALYDKFPCGDDVDIDTHIDALSKALDETIEAYTTNGKLVVEDWDMFDQDLTTNAYNEMDKIYGE
jgi:hypothetical protein